MKRDVEKGAPRPTDKRLRPAPAMLVEHECRMRREPVPAVKHRDGTVRCVCAECCSDCRDGML